MKAYAVDVRTRVLAALDRGMSRDAAIATFQVSRSTIKRWLGRRTRTGDLTPGQSPGRPKRVTAVGLEQLQTRLQDAPDGAPGLVARAADLAAHQSCHARPRHCAPGLVAKKRRSTPANATQPREPPFASNS